MRRRDEGLALQTETKERYKLRTNNGEALMAEWSILGTTRSMVKRRVSDTYLFVKSRMTDHLARRQSYNVRWGLQCFQPQTIHVLIIDPQLAYRPGHCFRLRLLHVVEFWFFSARAGFSANVSCFSSMIHLVRLYCHALCITKGFSTHVFELCMSDSLADECSLIDYPHLWSLEHLPQ
jgi:hypothetical protein